jgi:hypothetical protein
MAKRNPEQVLGALDKWGKEVPPDEEFEAQLDAEVDAQADAEFDAQVDAEMERVLAMTPEEREAELHAAGIDVEAERAKAREWREKAERGEIPEANTHSAEPPATNGKAVSAGSLVPIDRARKRRVGWAVGLAMAATIGGVYATSVSSLTGGGDKVRKTPAADASEMRQRAAEACGRSKWSDCLQDLDDADRLDPAGANEPGVQELRRAAQAGLHEKR